MKAERTALIGDTGFVGSNMLAQHSFDATYNSKTIQQIDGRAFGAVVCAGVTALKWWANQNEAEDLARIEALMARLDRVECDHFTLISTVDVYGDRPRVTEATALALEGLHPYGRNRALLEEYVARRFERRLIVRLPALFGAGLKKNAVYDLMHDNRLAFIHPDSSFQWYPLARLSRDLAAAGALGLSLLNLAVEPVAMAALAARFFPGKRLGGEAAQPSHYDVRSLHAAALGGQGDYVVTADAAMDELGRFLRGAVAA